MVEAHGFLQEGYASGIPAEYEPQAERPGESGTLLYDHEIPGRGETLGRGFANVKPFYRAVKGGLVLDEIALVKVQER